MSEDKRYVEYNGVRVVEGWPVRIEEAQRLTTYTIGGRLFQRVQYGHEQGDWGANERPCHDCAVIKHQFHVVGCDVERCPACGGQVISCDCDYDGD